MPEHPARDRPASKPAHRFRRALKRLFPVAFSVLQSSRQTAKEVIAIAGFLPAQLRAARSLDAVIVLGGGQIHDFWGGPLGHPATLFHWALACRLARKPFLVVSVGAVELKHPLSLWFIRNAFRHAAHVTVRDEASAQILRRLGVCPERQVLPDLAWGLRSIPSIARRTEVSPSRRPLTRPRIVGVSPMVYRHPLLWPGGDEAAYDGYIGALASFSSRLIGEGYEVVLFPTQIRSDVVAIEDLAARIPSDLKARIRLWQVDGVQELLNCLASVDVVVTTRFHGLLLSLLARRPALSLSYQQKNDALLAELGQGQFALDVHRLTPDRLWESFERLCNQFDAYTLCIGPHLERNRRLLDAQYEKMLKDLGWRPPAPSAETAASAP